MKKSKQIKLMIVIAVFVIAIILVFELNYRLEQAASNNYSSYLESITNKSLNLTRSYQNEIALWNDHKYSNATMAKITENYIPKFVAQLDQFNKTSAPAKYSKVKENYVKSFDSEIKSYRLFDIFLKTNNSIANNLSIDYLSLSLTFETIARNAFDEVNNNSSVAENKDKNLNQLLIHQQPISYEDSNTQCNICSINF